MTEIASQPGADKQCTRQEAVNEELAPKLLSEVLTSGQSLRLPSIEGQNLEEQLLPLLGNLEITGTKGEAQSWSAFSGVTPIELSPKEVAQAQAVGSPLSEQNYPKATEVGENALPQFTVQSFLATRPEDLPRHSLVLFGPQSSSALEQNAQLLVLKQEYDAKYGVKLDYAGELTAAGAKLTALVHPLEESQETALAPSTDVKARVWATDGNTAFPGAEQKVALDCATAQENAFASKMLGFDLNSSPEAIHDERNRLVYKLPPEADASRQEAIKRARAYGLDENLPTEELQLRLNATSGRKWAEILHMDTALPSPGQVGDAQAAAYEKAVAGLPPERAKSVGEKLWTSWYGQYAGLENYENYDPAMVKVSFEQKAQQEQALALGLPADSTNVDIQNYMERKAMQVDPRLSDEEVEHIRQARQLHLADDIAVDELAKRVREAAADRLAMLKSCSPDDNEADGGNPAPFQW